MSISGVPFASLKRPFRHESRMTDYSLDPGAGVIGNRTRARELATVGRRVVRLRNSYQTGVVPPEPLGQRIKKERLALGMTQRDLAVALKITVPYVSKIETGRETPTTEKIVKVAEVLGLDPDELLLAAGRMPADVVDRLVADPTEGLEFLRRIRR